MKGRKGNINKKQVMTLETWEKFRATTCALRNKLRLTSISFVSIQVKQSLNFERGSPTALVNLTSQSQGRFSWNRRSRRWLAALLDFILYVELSIFVRNMVNPQCTRVSHLLKAFPCFPFPYMTHTKKKKKSPEDQLQRSSSELSVSACLRETDCLVQ